MIYEIELEKYEGPMELLLDLIKRNEIDIYDIPITEITEQFLEYINKMESMDLEVSSEFIVMAATLIEIKSKMLLPNPTLEGEEEADPREKLVEKILEYRYYKEAALKMAEMNEKYGKVIYKMKDEYAGVDEIELIESSNPEVLLKTLVKLINKKKIEPDIFIENVRREEFTIEECGDIILKKLDGKVEIGFFSIIEGATLSKVINLFLALLELIKQKKVRVSQKNMFDDIIVLKGEANDSN